VSQGPPPLYFGLDGEGHGRAPHLYTLLAVASSDEEHSFHVENPQGLSTVDCLDFLLSLPRKIDGRAVRLFGFSLGYDWTKILADVDDESLYLLNRSELRRTFTKDDKTGETRPGPPWNVHWRKYAINLIGSKVTLSDGSFDPRTGKKLPRLTIWDIFKFYQSKFVSALTDWKVGTVEEWAFMTDMKENRAKFDALIKSGQLTEKEIRRYCLKECARMAGLAEKLQRASESAGIPLKVYYGAGSLAGGMLQILEVKGKRGVPLPEMRRAVACAFAGGRFENSVIGTVPGPVWSYDISSAYPYQIVFLPCLEHGDWERVTDERELDRPGVAASLVRYGLGTPRKEDTSWGPFPFRIRPEGAKSLAGNDTSGGSICFPIQSGGGWVWGEEYKAGRAAFPHVQFREAWVLRINCECQPFLRVPAWYLERLKLGKEGPGIVLKLAMNSIYGKLAQSVGNAQFQSWVWAGIITSGCRAQILRILALHKDRRNMLMTATDGICTLEKLVTPVPQDTGTFEARNEKGELKPLGAWEEKCIEQGMFLARPGVYFPLNPSEKELKEVRGRGVGKDVVLQHWKSIVETYEKEGVEGIARVPNLSRFCGMKTSISRTEDRWPNGAPRGWKYRRASGGIIAHKEGGGHDAPSYGEWVERRVELSFNPRPKREGVHEDGVHLLLRYFPSNLESAPYDRAGPPDEDAVDLTMSEEELSEQPDGDLTVYG